jgi:hypothetical protein
MTRAAVLIGVEKTGGLPTLRAVRSGVGEMRCWAAAQPGMGDRITVLHDGDGSRVTVGDITHAIRAYIDLGTVEQMVVYFAGHGVNVKFREYWLLSDAPDDPHAAVNVAGSVDLARLSTAPQK